MLTWHSISRKRSGGNVWLSKLRAAHKNMICLALCHVTVSATWDRPGDVYIYVNGTQSSLMEALSGSSWGESSRPELLGGRLITAISKLTNGKEHPDLIRAGSCQECCHQSGHCHPPPPHHHHRPRQADTPVWVFNNNAVQDGTSVCAQQQMKMSNCNSHQITHCILP